MIFSSRKVNELYQRYCRQVLKILRSPSYDLTGEECREIWDEIWKEAMRRKRELRKLKSEEETMKCRFMCIHRSTMHIRTII